jgi:hypothetical protein
VRPGAERASTDGSLSLDFDGRKSCRELYQNFPDEQVEADLEGMIVVVYKGNRKLTPPRKRPNKFSFPLAFFAHEEFVETKRRVEVIVVE